MSRHRFQVRVDKDYLVFCCGHFITYNGHQCERLHGHNYRAAVEVDGMLDENYYVFDFIALKRLTRAITDELDHHMLLATRNHLIQLEADDHRVHVRYQDREWIFPRGDCILLPIENTTAELIARYIAERLLTALEREYQFVPQAMRVEVEESFGQAATYVWELDA